MGYWQTSVVIDGALDSDDELTDRQLTRLRREIEVHATDHPDQQVEVYALWHDHARGRDCECVQYAQDHHPLDTYNMA